MKKAGKMKLKRAMVTTHHPTGSKETEVCEFDFSNYPYYYNYPQHNISLEEEDVQMAFVKEITSFVTDVADCVMIGFRRIQERASRAWQ